MLKRDISATFAGSMVLAVIMLGTVTVTSRWLGPEGRGILALALLLPSITTTFAMLGQESVNSTFAGLYKEARAGLFLQSLVITAFGTLVSVLVVCAYFFWLPIPRGNFGTLSTEIILASCMIAPMSIFSTLMFSLVRGVGQVVLASILRIVAGATLLAALFVFLVVLEWGVLAAVWVMALAHLPASVLAIWFLRHEISLRPSALPRWLWGRSLRFGLPICLATLAGFLIYRLDQGILGYLVERSDLGLYTLAVSLAEHLRMVPGSISTAFLPRLANEMASRQGQVPAVFRATMIASLAAMVGAGVFGIPAILVLFGWEFTGSIVPFLLLLPGIAALGGASVLASDLLTRQKTHYNVTVAWSTLAVSAGLNLLLIPILGIAGAAITASVAYTMALGLWTRFYLRESGRSFRELVPAWEDLRRVWSGGLELVGQVLRRTRLLPVGPAGGGMMGPGWVGPVPRHWRRRLMALACVLAAGAVVACPIVLASLVNGDGYLAGRRGFALLSGLSGLLATLSACVVIVTYRPGPWVRAGAGLWWYRRIVVAMLGVVAAVGGSGFGAFYYHRNHVDLLAMIDRTHPVCARMEEARRTGGRREAMNAIIRHLGERTPFTPMPLPILWRDSPADSERMAEAILAGRLGELFESPSYQWRPEERFRWKAPTPVPVLFAMQRQALLFPLLNSGSEGITAARAMMEEWRRGNRDWPNFNQYVWNDDCMSHRICAHMAVMQVLRSGGQVSDEDEKAFLTSLIQHGRHLTNRREYNAKTNHGLMQNYALLSMALQYPEFDRGGRWRETAVRRMQEHAAANVTAEGVSREVTPSYHYFVTRAALWFLATCEQADVEVSPQFAETVRKMLVFCREILHPDRSLPLIADTESEVVDLTWWPHEHLPALPELAALREAVKPSTVPPNEPGVRLWPGAGYLVLRAPAPEWTTSSALMLTLRCGEWSVAHSHYDALALTLFAGGRALLAGPGYPSYRDAAERQALIGTPSQTTVSVDGASHRQGDCKARWLDVRPAGTQEAGMPAFVAFQGESQLYAGVVHRRSLFFGPGVRTLLVVDELASQEPHVYRQQFRVAEGLNAGIADGALVAVSGDEPAETLLRIESTVVCDGQVGRPETGLAGPVGYFAVTGRNAVLVTLLDASGGTETGRVSADAAGAEWAGERGRLSLRWPIESQDSYDWQTVAGNHPTGAPRIPGASAQSQQHERPLQGRLARRHPVPRPSAWADRTSPSGSKTWADGTSPSGSKTWAGGTSLSGSGVNAGG